MPDPLESTFTDQVPAQPSQTLNTQTSPQQVPATPEPDTSWKDYAQSLGYDVSEVADPKDLIERVHQQTLALRNQQYYQQPQQPQQPQEPQPEDPDAYWKQHWSAPEFNDNWLQVLDRDPESGLFISKFAGSLPMATGQVVDAANNWLSWYQNQPKEFFQGNPYRQTYNVIREPILNDVRELVNEAIYSALTQREQQSTMNTFEQEHFKDIYVLDAQGRAMLDLQKQPVMTEWGQKLLGNMRKLRDSGVDPNSKACLDLAMQLSGEPPQPEKPGKGKKQPEGQPDDKAKSFVQGALEKAMDSPGYAGYTTPTPGDAEFLTDGEVENAFIQAAARAAATT